MTETRIITTLTALRAGTATLAAGLLLLYAGLWLGAVPEDVCLTIGVTAGIVAFSAWCVGVSSANPYLEKPPVDHLARDVRRLGWACAACALVILAYPTVP